MQTEQELKDIVREKYRQIATQEKGVNQASCCGATDVSNEVYNIMADDYGDLEGYASQADLGLGCGLPTAFAQIKNGDTVLDLGSGAGNDCFVARHETGPTGKVIGVDFTQEMIDQARKNADALAFNNVEFRFGDIEELPVTDNSVDVVVSNCVLNLVPNKHNVLKEVLRVLKPGGHFSISDIVLIGTLPSALQSDAEMYAGCVSGAIQKEEYLGMIHSLGFENVTLQKEKAITIPEDILSKYLSKDEINAFGAGESGIYSITVFGQKKGGAPLVQTTVASASSEPCCEPGSGCC